MTMNNEDTKILKAILIGFVAMLGVMVIAVALTVYAPGLVRYAQERIADVKRSLVNAFESKRVSKQIPEMRRIRLRQAWSLSLPMRYVSGHREDTVGSDVGLPMDIRWKVEAKDGRIKLDQRELKFMKHLLYKWMLENPRAQGKSDAKLEDNLKKLLDHAWINIEDFRRTSKRVLANAGGLPTFLPEFVEIEIKAMYYPKSERLDISIGEAE